MAVFCSTVFFSVQAGTVGVDPTNGVVSLVSGSGGLTLGWEFQVSATNGIIVDGLGFWDHQSDGFVLGQTFPVGLWDASSGTLLRSSVATSTSTLKPSLDPDGSWRVVAISPVYLAPGLYRIGALMPTGGANQIVVSGATVQSAAGVNVVRHLRQIGSSTLAMPDLPMSNTNDVNFGPTFTFTPGPMPPSEAVVAPAGYTGTPGPSGLNTLVRSSGSPRAYQMQFSSNVLTGLPVGAKITELRFRLDTNGIAAFPTNTVSWSEYDVTLAQAANPVSAMSATFTSNMRSPVFVKTGTLSLSANSFPADANPHPFGSLIVFDTPYIYQGGDLVMLFRHSGSDSLNTTFLDAISSTTAGYGADFRAFSATTFGATTGVAASVVIAQIVFTYLPRQTLVPGGTNVVIVGAGGPPGGLYHLAVTTNMALPVSQWIPVATNLFDGGGGFRYTNSIDAGSPVRFYRVTP